jgi:hypothetical protein
MSVGKYQVFELHDQGKDGVAPDPTPIETFPSEESAIEFCDEYVASNPGVRSAHVIDLTNGKRIHWARKK